MGPLGRPTSAQAPSPAPSRHARAEKKRRPVGARVRAGWGEQRCAALVDWWLRRSRSHGDQTSHLLYLYLLHFCFLEMIKWPCGIMLWKSFLGLRSSAPFSDFLCQKVQRCYHILDGSGVQQREETERNQSALITRVESGCLSRSASLDARSVEQPSMVWMGLGVLELFFFFGIVEESRAGFSASCSSIDHLQAVL